MPGGLPRLRSQPIPDAGGWCRPGLPDPRRPDDPGDVPQGCRNKRRLRLEESLVLRKVPGQAAAKDDQVGPEVLLQVAKEVVEFVRPRLPADLAAEASGAGEVLLVGIGWRALGLVDGGSIIWFWIGSHADFDRDFG